MTEKGLNPMVPPLNPPIERPKASRLLIELQKERRLAMRSLDPSQKMQSAFALSVNARKLLIAGLQAQGFSEPEIHAILRMRRK
jgi:hypothetical protein